MKLLGPILCIVSLNIILIITVRTLKSVSYFVQVLEVVEVKDAADNLVEDEFKKLEEELNSKQSKTK